jgi:pimeloyl-ACP methyl ester carboxylesterase
MRIRRAIPTVYVLLLSLTFAGQALAQITAVKESPFQKVAVRDGALEYRVVGAGEPVLLVHGAIFSSVGFDPLLPEAALKGYQLISYNRRGYAGSTRARVPFTMADQAADALALLDKLGIRRAHIVGHSYGGAIALQIAQNHPERVASLSLFEPAIFEPTPALQEVFNAINTASAIFQKTDTVGALSLFMDKVGAQGSWDEMTRQGATAMQAQAVADAGTFFNVEVPAMAEWKFTFDDVAKLRMPVFYLTGQASRTPFQETHMRLKQTLPQATGVLLPNAGHELQMSQPAAVAGVLAAFLKKHRM